MSVFNSKQPGNLQLKCLQVIGLAAHRAGYAGVGAAVRAANPGVGDSDLMGFLAYGLWYEPLERGPSRLLPGHNCSLDRDALLSLGDDLAEALACDLVLHGRLAARPLPGGARGVPRASERNVRGPSRRRGRVRLPDLQGTRAPGSRSTG